MEAGYKFPEPFKVKADDGITDLYGVMYKPFDFDPGKKYPIIEYVYPGPQTESVTQVFTPKQQSTCAGQPGLHRDRGRQSRRQPAPLQVVSHVRLRQPARLRPGRQEGRRRTTGGALSARSISIASASPGHSGGGFMSTAAMLIYPDFFKVGGVGIRQSREQRLQQHLERKAPRRQRSDRTRTARSRSNTPSTRTRRSPRT